VGVVQLIYIGAAVLLGLVVPEIPVGSSVPTSKATELLTSVGAGFVPFIGIVYSMLFLVVQFGSTTYTPRLNLFRDSPIVWHGFALFTAVIVFAFTATFKIASNSKTTLLVPIVLVIAVLAAVTVMRLLQTAAFKSIQLSAILEQLTKRGHDVIDGIHPEPLPATAIADDSVAEEPAGPGHEVLWPRRSAVLQRFDVPRLLQLAEKANACVVLWVAPGATIFDGQRVAVAHGAGLTDRELLEAFTVGPERTFDQDPAFALRLLADISLRALSPAVNDPTTASQALDAIADLLRVLSRRDLGAVVVKGADGTLRVVVKLNTWEDYVSIALDEIISLESSSIQIHRTLTRMLTDLLAISPPQHQEAVKRRLVAATANDTR
jgi:uncharacterized membrane protein